MKIKQGYCGSAPFTHYYGNPSERKQSGVAMCDRPCLEGGLQSSVGPVR